jgi:uncharacterized Zn finger protein
MKCPECGERETIILGMVIGAHLQGGTAIRWCKNCGTTFRHSDFSDKIRDIKVPKLILDL